MLGKKEWLVLWAKLLQLYRSREGSQSVDKKNWLYGWWTFDQCGFWLTMLFWVNKIDKILHPKKPPVHLRWSWHWFSLTENFWTWLSETRSRGGARRAAQFFFWKPRKTWIFRFLARKAGKICSKFFIAFGRKKTLKNFAPKKRILTKFWKNIEKMLTKSGVFIVRFQFEWMNVSKSVGNS